MEIVVIIKWIAAYLGSLAHNFFAFISTTRRLRDSDFIITLCCIVLRSDLRIAPLKTISGSAVASGYYH